jgi:integrase
MSSSAIRIKRKVKLGDKWVMAAVPVGRDGRPDAKHVEIGGRKVEVSGGTFYLDHGYGKTRKRQACGQDVESVRRAIRTQGHVLELRSRGMEVDDAPEIAESRRNRGEQLRSLAQTFRVDPPGGFSRKSIKKYINAFDTFADWAEGLRVFAVADVDKAMIAKYIAHLQKIGLDASTIVPKVRIVLAELRTKGVEIKLQDRDLPTIVEREREIYTFTELGSLLAACTLEEFEMLQTFLLTGMRRMEVAYLAWADINPTSRTVRVTAKKDLGFKPKSYEERTIPVPQRWIELMQARGERLASDGAGLVFGTSRNWARRGSAGGKADSKMLEKLKQIARRSGLNCGLCMGMEKGEPVSCSTHPVCRRWGLHKFRHTYATSMLRDKVDIVTLSKWLGHKDLATTRIYLRALEAEESQPQVEQSTLARRLQRIPPKAGRGKQASLGRD